jgi:hypothetical protein
MHTYSPRHPAPNRPSSPPWWGGPVLRSIALGAALGLALALPLSVQAKTFRCTAGDVACLIAAINAANANGEANTIRLAAGTYTLTEADNGSPFDANGLPVITNPLTITGRGAEMTIIEREGFMAPTFRILEVAPTGTLTLKRLTLRGGNASSGGGIANSGTLTLVHTTVTGNSANVGGGITNSGTLTLVHTRLIRNRAFDASGILTSSGTVTIAHSIFANNAGSFSGPLDIRGGTVTLHASTVTDNFAQGFAVILNGVEGFTSGGTVIITESAIFDNSTDFAGAISNNGTMVITNTTIAANRPLEFRGGGISNSGGTLLLTNSTLAGNISDGGGGGITQTGGTVLLLNTILAQNSLTPFPSPGSGPNCAGSITSLGHNLIGDPTGCDITLQPSDLTGDPGLGAFTDNGRPGNGHFPLLPTSQALDAGNDALCPRTDQLGQRRVGPCDIGAIEFRERDDRHHEDDDQQDKEDDDQEDKKHDNTGPVAAAQAAP